ncbi:MAG: anti-sigma factor antagonist [Solirubrobacteraceae bacterium]|jgi:anti-sigma B factor antagonist|nr:anti-sigma factor antagonist [Solirubrobacteraceae bacterium]MEA2358269.1 anti-sigma factor antagonist [Solirubrobacteraceae bacterium]MEA2393842.1 anti-sigma factor antagonist [Solirubrobacteraceae bacterium]
MDPHVSEALTRDDTPFGCVVHRRGHASEIVLDGELDLAARQTLDDAVRAALEPGSVEAVVIDLRAVTFADSTTIAWMVAVDRRTRSNGVRLVVIAVPGPVRRLMEMTGLDARLTLIDDGPTR